MEKSPLDLSGIAQAIAYVSDSTAQRLSFDESIQFLAIPGHKDKHLQVHRNLDGNLCIESVPAAPPDREHVVLSVREFATVIEHLSDSRVGVEYACIWYNERGVVCTLNNGAESMRRDRVSCCLIETEELKSLAKCADQDLEQRDLVRLLRITLAGCATDESNALLRVMKSIKSATTSSARGSIGHGRESMGRDIESEVISEYGELPELITLRLRLYTDPELTTRHNVLCDVECDPQTHLFRLTVQPESLRLAFERQLKTLSTLLEQVGPAVVYGRP